jgi:hypothetical protein
MSKELKQIDVDEMDYRLKPYGYDWTRIPDCTPRNMEILVSTINSLIEEVEQLKKQLNNDTDSLQRNSDNR